MSRCAAGFVAADDDDDDDGILLATHAAVALVAAELEAQLELALATRDVIGQAKESSWNATTCEPMRRSPCWCDSRRNGTHRSSSSPNASHKAIPTDRREVGWRRCSLVMAIMGVMDAKDADRATQNSVRAMEPADVRWGQVEQDADVRAALGAVVDTDDGLDRALRSLVALSSKTIDSAASCGVTVHVGQRMFTAVHSDSRTLRVDADQYEVGSGPCLHAASTGEVVRVDSVQAERRWPRFADTAREENIRSFLAVPLSTGRIRFGSLNLYGEAEAAFTDADVDTAVGLTSVLAEVLGDYDRFDSLRSEVQGLREAMEHRAPIEQAKGILMAVHGVTAEKAFAVLVERSQHTNRKVRDLAQELIESVRNPNRRES